MSKREEIWKKATGGESEDSREAVTLLAKKAVTAVLLVLFFVLFFRYLFPFILPLLFGWLISLLLRPLVTFFHRFFHLPEGPATVAAVLLALAGVCLLLYGAGCLMGGQVLRLAEQLPMWWQRVQSYLQTVFARAEQRFGLANGCLMNWMGSRLQEFSTASSDWLMRNSSVCIQNLVSSGAMAIFVFLYIILWLREGTEIRQKVQHKIAELPGAIRLRALLGTMKQVGISWVCCEGKIMLTICVLCVAGLWILGNPYALSLGILLGLLDALPLIGTGTVLIPWAFVSFFIRKWGQGLLLFALYLICYLLREIWEARCFSRPLGGSALESLTAMYVGWRTEGLLGLILGPIIWILIREILHWWDEGADKDSGEGAGGR